MYLAMLIIGAVTIVIGLIMPKDEADRIIHSSLIFKNNQDRNSTDEFSYKLLEQQLALINKRIDIASEKLLNLEEIIKDNTFNKISDNVNIQKVAETNSTDTYDISTPVSTAASEEFNDINSIIYNMYDNGTSLDEISSALRIGRGELQLRLGLRNSQRK